MPKKLAPADRRAIIAANVRRLREQAGQDQSWLAELWGMSQGNISQVERGESHPPTAEKLWILADALGVKLDEFTRIPAAIVT